MKREFSKSELADIAKQVGDDWVDGQYYDDAEAGMEAQWDKLIWPIIKNADFTSVVELAAGHGRNTARLLPLSNKLTAIDINQTNIDFMAKRFKGHADKAKLKLVRNDGAELAGVADASVSFGYCFDAMVHFDSDIVRAYIAEFNRVLKPDGLCFIHYSNNSSNPTGTYRAHPGWRNFMSRALFNHWVTKEGMEVVRTEFVKWNFNAVELDDGDTDAVTLFRKL